MDPKAEKEFRCYFCQNPADRIVYYSKTYQHNNKKTIENPRLVCPKCYNPTNNASISRHRGGIEGVYCLLFSKLSATTKKTLGYLMSYKGKEINELSSPYWKRQIWRIYYLGQPAREKVVGGELSSAIQRVL